MSETTKTSSSSFDITTTDVCTNTSITDTAINYNMSNGVSLTAVKQDVTFMDSVADSKGIPAYCGSRTYSIYP